jgi:hypothetical protein
VITYKLRWLVALGSGYQLRIPTGQTLAEIVVVEAVSPMQRFIFSAFFNLRGCLKLDCLHYVCGEIGLCIHYGANRIQSA